MADVNVPQQAKSAADYTSVGVIFGAWVEVLPHVAALLSIAWMGIRIYETRTMQRMIGREVRTREDD